MASLASQACVSCPFHHAKTFLLWRHIKSNAAKVFNMNRNLKKVHLSELYYFLKATSIEEYHVGWPISEETRELKWAQSKDPNPPNGLMIVIPPEALPLHFGWAQPLDLQILWLLECAGCCNLHNYKDLFLQTRTHSAIETWRLELGMGGRSDIQPRPSGETCTPAGSARHMVDRGFKGLKYKPNPTTIKVS